MGDRMSVELDHLPKDLQTLAHAIEQAALTRRGDEISLLQLLRLLEALHGSIRDSWFQEALPTNRQRLYALLRDIEVSGGWPYIQRMRLRSLLNAIELEEQTAEPQSTQERDAGDS